MKDKKVVAIIQARMNSSRLPGKVMLSLKGKPALQRLIERVQLSAFVDETVVALPYGDINDPILEVCSDMDTDFFWGSEEDVMQRVLNAAHFYEADVIVDVTGDCPFVDPRHISRLVYLLEKNKLDYISNVVERTWPDGLDIQVYYTWALEKVREMFNPPHHVGWNIPQHPGVFNAANCPAPPGMYWPELRLTLDTLEDYVLLSNLAVTVNWPDFKVEDVIRFIKNNPHLAEINKNVRTKKIEEG